MRQITDINELRQIQMGILDEVHRFCEAHGLRYFLSSGTLIGAVVIRGIFLGTMTLTSICRVRTMSDSCLLIVMTRARIAPSILRRNSIITTLLPRW